MLDTSVVVAGLRSSAGASAEILRIALAGQLTFLLDYKLACEYREVCFRREHLEAAGRTREEVAWVLDMLEAVAEPIEVKIRHRPVSPDPGDEMVLDVALNGGADAIVTFNVRHFRSAAAAFHLRLLTPAELLIDLKGR